MAASIPFAAVIVKLLALARDRPLTLLDSLPALVHHWVDPGF